MHILHWKARLLLTIFLHWKYPRLSWATRLACQQEIRARPSGVVVVSHHQLPPAPGTRDVMATLRSERRASPRADLCCGDRAFSSEVGTCCLGRTISNRRKVCCLDGTTVPVDSTCVCHPPSDWIITEMEIILELEGRYMDLIETASLQITSLKQKERFVSAEIERLDGLENHLYQSFLDEVGVGHDPNELDYIVELIAFLNINEANMDGANKGLRLLDKATQRLGNDVINNEEATSLKRLRREIETMNSTILTADSLAQVVRSELAMSLEENERKTVIEEILFERDQILLTIKEKERSMRMLLNRMIILKRLISILHSDYDLLVSTRRYLDQVLDHVFTMEKNFEEEHEEILNESQKPARAERKRRSAGESLDETKIIIPQRRGTVPPPFLLQLYQNHSPPGSVVHSPITPNSFTNARLEDRIEKGMLPPPPTLPSTITIDPPSTTVHPPCNFTLWHQFIATFAQKTDIIMDDLAKISSITSQGNQAEEAFTRHKRSNGRSDDASGVIVKKTGNSIDGITTTDDVILDEHQYYSELTSYAWMGDFQVFQFSDSFISNLIELMSNKKLGIFNIL